MGAARSDGMNEAQRRKAPDSIEAIRQRLGRLALASRASLGWERLWPRLWLPAAILLSFLAVSWFGLWTHLPWQGRALGVAAVRRRARRQSLACAAHAAADASRCADAARPVAPGQPPAGLGAGGQPRRRLERSGLPGAVEAACRAPEPAGGGAHRRRAAAAHGRARPPRLARRAAAGGRHRLLRRRP